MEQAHFSEQELSDYIIGKLTDPVREQHINQCPHCKKHIIAYRLVNQFLEADQAEILAEEIPVWNMEVLTQIEQMEYRRERRNYWWQIAACLIGWFGIMAWLGFMGIFSHLWQVFSTTEGRLFLTIGISISLVISCFDWLEKALKLDVDSQLNW